MAIDGDSILAAPAAPHERGGEKESGSGLDVDAAPLVDPPRALFEVICVESNADVARATTAVGERGRDEIVVVDVRASGAPLPVFEHGVLEDVVRHRTRGGNKRPTRREIAYRLACTWRVGIVISASTDPDARASLIAGGHDVVVTCTPPPLVALFNAALPLLVNDARGRVPVALAAIHRGLCAATPVGGASQQQPPPTLPGAGPFDVTHPVVIADDPDVAAAWRAEVAAVTGTLARVVRVVCDDDDDDVGAAHTTAPLPIPRLESVYTTCPPTVVLLMPAAAAGGRERDAPAGGASYDLRLPIARGLAAAYLTHLARAGQLYDTLPVQTSADVHDAVDVGIAAAVEEGKGAGEERGDPPGDVQMAETPWVLGVREACAVLEGYSPSEAEAEVAAAAAFDDVRPAWLASGDRLLARAAVCVEGSVGFVRATGKVAFLGVIPRDVAHRTPAVQHKIQVIASLEENKALFKGVGARGGGGAAAGKKKASGGGGGNSGDAGAHPPLTPGDSIVVRGLVGCTRQGRVSVYATCMRRWGATSRQCDALRVLHPLRASTVSTDTGANADADMVHGDGDGDGGADGGIVVFTKPPGMTGALLNEMKPRDHPAAMAVAAAHVLRDAAGGGGASDTEPAPRHHHAGRWSPLYLPPAWASGLCYAAVRAPSLRSNEPKPHARGSLTLLVVRHIDMDGGGASDAPDPTPSARTLCVFHTVKCALVAVDVPLDTGGDGLWVPDLDAVVGLGQPAKGRGEEAPATLRAWATRACVVGAVTTSASAALIKSYGVARPMVHVWKVAVPGGADTSVAATAPIPSDMRRLLYAFPGAQRMGWCLDERTAATLGLTHALTGAADVRSPSQKGKGPQGPVGNARRTEQERAAIAAKERGSTEEHAPRGHGNQGGRDHAMQPAEEVAAARLPATGDRVAVLRDAGRLGDVARAEVAMYMSVSNGDGDAPAHPAPLTHVAPGLYTIRGETSTAAASAPAPPHYLPPTSLRYAMDVLAAGSGDVGGIVGNAVGMLTRTAAGGVAGDGRGYTLRHDWQRAAASYTTTPFVPLSDVAGVTRAFARLLGMPTPTPTAVAASTTVYEGPRGDLARDGGAGTHDAGTAVPLAAIYVPDGVIIGRIIDGADHALGYRAAKDNDPRATAIAPAPTLGPRDRHAAVDAFCRLWDGKPFSFSGSMDPAVAVLLFNVACLALETVRPGRGRVGGDPLCVVDGCCGSGTLSAAAARVFGCRVHAGELRDDFVANTAQNLRHAGVDGDGAAAGGTVTLRQHDASKAFPQGFTPCPPDLVVCNPPWGVRFGSTCESLPILTSLVRSFPDAVYLFVAPRHACKDLQAAVPAVVQLHSFPFGKASVFIARQQRRPCE